MSQRSAPFKWLGKWTSTECSLSLGGACWCPQQTSHCIISWLMSQSMFGQNTVVLALAIHLLMPKCPIWRHWRYSCCKDFEMMILVPFIMMPFTMCMLNLCIQNVCKSASKSPWLSPQPFCITLANLTSCGSNKVWRQISCSFPSWNVISAVTSRFKVSSSSAVSWHIMQLIQSAIITLVCLTYLTVYLYWFTLRNKCCNLGLNSARALQRVYQRHSDESVQHHSPVHKPPFPCCCNVVGWRLKHGCDTQWLYPPQCSSNTNIASIHLDCTGFLIIIICQCCTWQNRFLTGFKGLSVTCCPDEITVFCHESSYYVQSIS